MAKKKRKPAKPAKEKPAKPAKEKPAKPAKEKPATTETPVVKPVYRHC